MRRLSTSIELTKLPQTVIAKKRNKAGQMIDCLIIPIEGNGLTEHIDKAGAKTGRVFMNASVVIRDEEDQYGQIGFIAKNVDSDLYKKIKDDKDALNAQQPILGNLKDWENNTVKGADKINEQDDLPF